MAIRSNGFGEHPFIPKLYPWEFCLCLENTRNITSQVATQNSQQANTLTRLSYRHFVIDLLISVRLAYLWKRSVELPLQGISFMTNLVQFPLG